MYTDACTCIWATSSSSLHLLHHHFIGFLVRGDEPIMQPLIFLQPWLGLSLFLCSLGNSCGTLCEPAIAQGCSFISFVFVCPASRPHLSGSNRAVAHRLSSAGRSRGFLGRRPDVSDELEVMSFLLAITRCMAPTLSFESEQYSSVCLLPCPRMYMYVPVYSIARSKKIFQRKILAKSKNAPQVKQAPGTARVQNYVSEKRVRERWLFVDGEENQNALAQRRLLRQAGVQLLVRSRCTHREPALFSALRTVALPSCLFPSISPVSPAVSSFLVKFLPCDRDKPESCLADSDQLSVRQEKVIAR